MAKLGADHHGRVYASAKHTLSVRARIQHEALKLIKL